MLDVWTEYIDPQTNSYYYGLVCIQSLSFTVLLFVSSQFAQSIRVGKACRTQRHHSAPSVLNNAGPNSSRLLLDRVFRALSFC